MHEEPQPPLDEGAQECLKGARLVVLDVDGVLTDGRVVYTDHGEEQRFHVHDGAGIVWLRRSEVKVAWISGRGCAATRRRAEELGIDRLVLEAGPKHEVLRALQQQWSIEPEQTVAMGDDLPDLGLASRAGFFAAPANACAEVRARADLVTQARGGEGCVRELAELILRANGGWQAVLDSYGC